MVLVVGGSWWLVDANVDSRMVCTKNIKYKKTNKLNQGQSKVNGERITWITSSRSNILGSY